MPVMDNFLRDCRHAIRNLLRTPGFAIVTIVTLALGIGANTAIFSVVNAVILRPLGYPQPERLIYITSQFPTMGFDQFWISPPEFFEFRERAKTFSSVGAFAAEARDVDAPARARGRGRLSLLDWPPGRRRDVPVGAGRARDAAGRLAARVHRRRESRADADGAHTQYQKASSADGSAAGADRRQCEDGDLGAAGRRGV